MNEECDSYLFLGLYLHWTIICNYSLLRQNVLLDFQRFEKLNPHHFTSTQVFRRRPQWNMWVRALYLQISFEIETAWQRCKYLGVGLNMGYHGLPIICSVIFLFMTRKWNIHQLWFSNWTSVYNGSPIAVFDYQRVTIVAIATLIWFLWRMFAHSIS